MKRRIVITGVAGFIGSNLADDLLHQGYRVIGVDNLAYGIRDQVPEKVEFHQADIRGQEIYRIIQPDDVVFHLAAKNCISDCLLEPVDTASINVTGTVNVFEAARRAHAYKIIYAESSALYEGSHTFPTPEKEIHPESFYAVSKLASMAFADAYRRYYGLRTTALRYFCVYGPRQDYRRTIPPVMSAFILRMMRGQPPVIYGTGEKRRDFIHVNDINRFHLQCIEDPRTDGGVYNLGSGCNYSVRDICKAVARLLGNTIEPVFKPDLPGEAEETLADIAAARALGWQPRISLEQGLRTFIDYYKAHSDIIYPSDQASSGAK